MTLDQVMFLIMNVVTGWFVLRVFRPSRTRRVAHPGMILTAYVDCHWCGRTSPTLIVTKRDGITIGGIRHQRRSDGTWMISRTDDDRPGISPLPEPRTEWL